MYVDAWYLSKSYVVYIFTDGVKTSVNRDLGFGNAFVKPALSFI